MIYREKNSSRPYDQLTISKFLLPDFDIVGSIDKLTQNIYSSCLCFIDFDFVVETKDQDKPFKFEHASKPSSLNDTVKITSISDQQDLITQFKDMNHADLLNSAFIHHRELNDYGQSGFKPHQLLSLKIFVQLFPSKK